MVVFLLRLWRILSSMLTHDEFLRRLASGIVIFDGAMGTEIYKRHVFVNTSYDGLCLTAPDLIRGIHQAYAEAGADVLTTNSFGANANKLSAYGLAERMREINVAAVRLAREAAGAGQWVAGSVGPLGELPYGQEISESERTAMVAEHVTALAEAGADFILFETLGTRLDVERALRAMACRPDWTYVLSMTVDRQGETSRGEPIAALLAVITAAPSPPAAIGLNCGQGPDAMLSALEILMPMTTCPVIVQPNAGTPKPVEGRLMYMTSPEYLATYAQRYVQLGARGVGGCCGTTPDHIRELARSLRPMGRAHAVERAPTLAVKVDLAPRPPTAGKSRLANQLISGAWIRCVEIAPPRGWNLDATLAAARQCREAGVDAINVPDGPRASARLSPFYTALAIQREAEIEVILHFCSRDKSLLAMQADLLGCAAAGIHNILFITGDPPKLGDFPFSSAVFDADSIGMVKIQDHMNRGIDIGGRRLDPPTRVLIGVGADPNAIDMARELRRVREKVEAGAEFIITQPVFAREPLERFLEAIADLRLPVIAGVWPLASLRNAEFMRNEVPGVVVPDEVMRRMAAARDRENQRREGIAIARETIANIRSLVHGVQVSAPFGLVATALAVLAD